MSKGECSQDVLVSIIVPVYNCEKYLYMCLDSIKNQTYKELEIIIINDGSTDGSKDIIHTFLYDKRIVYIEQHNQGVSVARNRGLEKATGKYILFIDGDDYVGNQYVEKLVEKAEGEQADLVVCGYRMVDEKNKLAKEIVPGKYIPLEHEEWAYRISAACSRLYRKEVWDIYKIQFESGVRAEDVPIAFFLNARCKKITIVQNAEYYYVQHSQSAMKKLKGLKDYNLPFASIENYISKLEEIGYINSRKFYEISIIRFFTQIIFDLGRGASRENIKRLCNYAESIVYEHFPFFFHNETGYIFTDIEFPIIQKIEVKVFIVLLKFHLLYPCARIYTLVRKYI